MNGVSSADSRIGCNRLSRGLDSRGTMEQGSIDHSGGWPEAGFVNDGWDGSSSGAERRESRPVAAEEEVADVFGCGELGGVERVKSGCGAKRRDAGRRVSEG